jgi:oxygen-independent coproporphyrinogen-3 oxidase
MSEEKVRFLASCKVDQIDVGIQTFEDSDRKMLKLQDSGPEAKAKLKAARKNGLRISIDLLYNLPGQTLKKWEEDIRQALELEVESVDCYPLDLYPDTPLAKRIAAGELPPVNDDSTELEMYLQAFDLFKKNGYTPTCHNRFTRIKEDLNEPSSEVVGTGAGFFMGSIGKFLYSDAESIQDYVSAASEGVLTIARLATLTQEDEMRNAIMLIYVRVPVDRQKFEGRFGKFPEEAFPDAMRRLKEKQLIEIRNDKIRLTEKGDPWRFNIAWEFFKNQ